MRIIRVITFIIFSFSLVYAQTPCQGTTQNHNITAGTNDNFQAPSEPASPRSALGTVSLNFDDTGIGTFGHSFMNIPANITGGTLSLYLRPQGKTAQDDQIFVGFKDKGWVYQELLSNLSLWGKGDVWITLDLNTIGVTSQVASDGYLDIKINDNTSVDMMTLSYTTCEPDCNSNGIPDSDDISTGNSPDTNGNGIPDDCEELQASIECPADVVIEAGDNCCANVTLSAQVSGVGSHYTITNNIDPAKGGTFSHCFPIGATTVTFTLDPLNNQSPLSCSVTVIVTDTRGPVITPRSN